MWVLMWTLLGECIQSVYLHSLTLLGHLLLIAIMHFVCVWGWNHQTIKVGLMLLLLLVLLQRHSTPIPRSTSKDTKIPTMAKIPTPRPWAASTALLFVNSCRMYDFMETGKVQVMMLLIKPSAHHDTAILACGPWPYEVGFHSHNGKNSNAHNNN